MSEDKKKEEKRNLKELNDLLKQKDADKQQLQASYDEALQALADSEAKRETAERELKIAQDQMATMWKELESLHQRLDGSHPRPTPVSTSPVVVPVSPQPNAAQSHTTNIPSAKTTLNVSSPKHSYPVTSPPVISTVPPSHDAGGSIELCCTLCNEKIKSGTVPLVPTPTPTPSNSPAHSPPKTKTSYRLWPFGGGNSHHKTRLNDLNDHSKVCSSKLKSTSPSPPTHSPKQQRKLQSRGSSPKIQSEKRSSSLIVNVTRTPTAATDLAPFKVVTWTNMTSQFSSESYEVYRSAGDFQWLHDVLQDNCPERAVPPLRTTISLDATVSEYQRFLSRLVAHKTLRTEQSFIVFLTGTIEELRVLRAKFRPHLPSEESLQYRPTQGRDTSSGALVATKDYLHSLENNLLGLVHHLQQRTTNDTQREVDTMSHWFRHIAEGEPCDTYLKLSSGDLARTSEMIETQRSTFDGDDALCVQNLQSIADYIHSAVDLLTRVEEAVDRFLYWDEEVMIYEAVTSSPSSHDVPVTGGVGDEVFDDSGVSSISGSSTGGGGGGGGNTSSCHSRDESTPDTTNAHGSGNCWSPSRRNIGLDDSISEKWAQASSNCSDAKEYLEMICRDLSDELAQFDLRKEQELRQVFLDLAAGQMEKNEKLQGKWYAMKCLLDTPIKPSLRAIQFVSNNNTTTTTTTTTTGGGGGGGDNK